MKGLSHYLEHMIFMGNEQFRGESEFGDFVALHAGSTNAYTEAEYTNYHFDVEPAYLKPALEQFSALFKKPLCSESALEREVNAVESEFVGVSQNDECRLSGVLSSSCRPGHPLRTFMWGNKESLWTRPLAAGVPIRERILQHFREEYSSSRMCLAVLGGEGLDTLEAWVEELFGEVENKKIPPMSIAKDGLPFSGQRAYLAPALHEGHSLTVTWQLPPMQHLYHKKCDEYWSHLLGHEGPGSLLSELKAKQWVTDIYAGVAADGSANCSGFGLFQVEMTLTAAGVLAAPGGGCAPVEALFAYLRMLKDSGPQERVWQESKLISASKFQFKQEHEAIEEVTAVAASMLLFKPEHILRGPYVHEEWDEAMITQVGAALAADAEGMRIDLQSSMHGELREPFEKLFEDVTTGREEWFGFDYVSGAIPAHLQTTWAAAQPSPTMKLPTPNPFIATDFSLLPDAPSNTIPQSAPTALSGSSPEGAASLEGAVSQPTCLLDVPGWRLFHKPVTAFGTPRAVALFKISSPALFKDTAANAKAILLADCLKDVLTEVSYLADLAGLSSHVSNEDRTGLEITVSGFSQRLAALVQEVFKTLATLKAPATWSAIREQRLQRHRNAMLEVDKHCHRLRLQLLLHPRDPHATVQQALSEVQPESIEEFRQELLQQCHIEALVEGNVAAADAQSMVEALRQLCPGATLPAGDRPQLGCVLLPEKKTLVLAQPALNPKEANSAIQVYFQLGPFSLRLRALQLLCEQVLREPVYNVLRTDQQLGYAVGTSPTVTGRVLGLLVSVRSSLSPDHVHSAISQFLEGFRAEIEGMSEESLQEHKRSVSLALLEAAHNIDEQADEHWTAIWNQQYTFYEKYQVAAEIKSLSKEDLLALYGSHILPAGESTRKLIVSSVTQIHGTGFKLSESECEVSVGDISEIKHSLPVSTVASDPSAVPEAAT